MTGWRDLQTLSAYAVVLLVGGFITYAVTPIVVAASRKIGAVDIPGDRKVHAVPTPTLGGTAIFMGFVAAIAAASSLSEFAPSFRPTTLWPPTEVVGIVVGASIVFAMGVIDDLRGVRAPVKFAGHLLAAGVVFLSGVRLQYFPFPGAGALSLSPDLSAIATVVWIVVIVNAVNLIDGLDGLAAGITAIAAGTFFVYSYQLTSHGLAAEPNAPLLTAAVLGTTLGFLRFNFNPARIFMGDSGAYTLGFLLAVATAIGVGRTAPNNPFAESGAFLFYLPLAIPLIVLAIPILDTALAVVRRARRGGHIFHADKEHLHHRLLEIGHGHRQAVLIMYAWTLAIGALALALSFVGNRLYVFGLLAAALALMLYTLLPRILRSRPS